MKKFKQRLLSMILVVLMVAGMLPVEQMATVVATDFIPAGTIIYFQPSATWKQADAMFGFVSTANNTNQTMVVMEEIEGTGIYKGALKAQATNIQFSRLDPQNTSNAWNTQNSWPALESGKNLYVLYDNAWNEATGYWSTYTEPEIEPDTSETFYVQADLVDYYNDARIEDSDNTGILDTDNQGDILGDKNEHKGAVAFSYLNGKISSIYGNNSTNIPLYFGSLLFLNNRLGRTDYQTAIDDYLNLWNSTANVALTIDGQNNNNVTTATHNTDAAVQGLVYKFLGANGELLARDGQTELPYFNKDLETNNAWKINGKSLINYYENYEFPFKVTSMDGSTVKKYSYDSENDYGVQLSSDENNKTLIKSNSVHTKNITDNTNGYYPFNTLGETVQSNINYGFGTKFTIPFTINENGTINGKESGEAITFNFTGDDDVWVFIDGKLVLDMGGAHGKATGSIDFKNLTATVEDAATATTSESLSAGVNTTSDSTYSGLDNYIWRVNDPSGESGTEKNQYAQERSAEETGTKTLNFSTYGTDFANSFKDSSQTHELVMFYMERGMFDSNMKVEFTINPLPSGLSLSKTIDTSNVNDGLEEDVKKADDDNFEFEIKTKKLSVEGAVYSPVENLGYTLNNYNNQDTPGYTAANGVVTGVGLKNFAHTFINTSTKADAFVAGTGFQITEKTDVATVFQYDYSETKWTVYNKKDNYSVLATQTRSTVATFDMGDSNSSEFDSYDYDVNFRNKLKVGALTLTKKYEGTAPEGAVFNFQVAVDLDGDGTVCVEKNYKLDYTIDGDENTKYQTSQDGELTLTAGQTVTFAGIPAGAKVKVTEIIGETDPWEAVNGKVQEATITSGTTSAIIVTNKTKEETLDKVIYVEATETTDDNSDAETVYEVEKNKDEKVTVTELAIENLPEGTTAKTNDDGSVTYTIKKQDSDGNSVTTEITARITEEGGKLVIKTENANGEYDIPYKGTDPNGVIISGTVKVYSYRATNKVYVFDYGLESDIAATNENNDGLFQDGVFHNDNATGDDATTATLGEIKDKEGSTNPQTSIECDAPNPLIKEDGSLSNAKVMFTPDAFMDSVEEYVYKANVVKKGATLDTNNPETGTVVNGTIKVMPANSVYYEDNFNAGTETTDDGSLKIVYTNSTSAPTTNPTETQSNDQSENYGHDDAYSDDLEASGGSFTTMDDGDGAYFTFKGTGFDIISRTNNDTAGIAVYVFKGKKTTFTENDFKALKDADGKVTTPFLKSIMVDTYYSNGDLYQVPVISTTMDEGYGEYTVYIKALSTYTGQSVIYIDGVRIYNPLGTDNEEYLETEKGIVVEELRQMLFDNRLSLVTEESEDGYYAVDSGATVVENYDPENAEPGEYALGDLENTTAIMLQGPNNELYLPLSNGIGFSIAKPEGDGWTLQIGAKSVSADDVAADEEDLYDSDKSFTVYVKPSGQSNIAFEEVATYAINTSTDMYYDIEKAVLNSVIEAKEWKAAAYDIVILNTSSDYNIYDFISLTTVKHAQTTTLSKIATVTRSGYVVSGRTKVTVDENPILSAKFNVSNVTRGKNVTMTVVTTPDTEDVKIIDPTGAEVTSFSKQSSSIDEDGNVVWSFTFKAIKTKGEATYQVQGVVDGQVTGDAYSVTIAVR